MLYVDDTRPRPSRKWKLVRSVEEAQEFFLRNGCPNLVSFDYNLGDGTGIELVNWMIERDRPRRDFFPVNFRYKVHSSDPFGAMEIRETLDAYLAKRRISIRAPGTPSI